MIEVVAALMAASVETGIDYSILHSLCKVESGLNPAAINHYDGGTHSYGLCQIKLSTAKLMGYRGDATALMSPKTNAMYAAKYLKHQLNRYDGNMWYAVSAYNMGTAKTNKDGKVWNAEYVYRVLYGQ